MVLKITNNATTTVPLAIQSTDTSLTVATGTGSLFPVLGAGDFFFATLSSTAGGMEIIKVTARADDVMTIERAQESTLAIPFAANSRLEIRVTAANLQNYIDSLDFLLL
jgi:hypothetical protein